MAASDYEPGSLNNPLPQPPWMPVSSSWLTAWRFLAPGAWKGLGLVTEWQLHLKFSDGHTHWYSCGPQVVYAFGRAESKGKFVHRVLLGPDWTPTNHASRYPNGPL